VLPLINDSDEQFEALAAASAAAGAMSLGANVLFLKPAAQAAFFPFLEEKFPHLVRRYRERFAKSAYLRGAYPDRVRERFRRIRFRHGLTARFPEYVPEAWPEEAQLSLDF
jgi:DNA repair photolyase